MSSIRKSPQLIRFAVVICAFIGESMTAQNQNSSFVIDSSRPCVYIEFQRVAKRKPLSDEEVSTGVWLHLKNNSRVPIRVMTFDPGTGDQETGVMDEVVQVNSPVGFGPSGNQAQPVTFEAAGSPKGYSLDVGSTAVIGPGESLPFSVPLNHVGPSWYLRVRFDFDLPPTKAGRQPYSFVDFSWADIPVKDRGTWAALGQRRRP
jgi:hypothetical protein